MKPGYNIVTRGTYIPSTVWVFNFPFTNEIHNVLWDNTHHADKDNPFIVAIFKIKYNQ